MHRWDFKRVFASTLAIAVVLTLGLPGAGNPAPQSPSRPSGSGFEGTTFSNDHVRIEISPTHSVIYSPSGDTLIAERAFLGVEELREGAWVRLDWSWTPSFDVVSIESINVVLVRGYVLGGSLAVTIAYQSSVRDEQGVPLSVSISIASVDATGTYRIVSELGGLRSQLLGLARSDVAGIQDITMTTPVSGEVTLDLLDSEALVALDHTGKRIQMGINWGCGDSAPTLAEAVAVRASSGSDVRIYSTVFALDPGGFQILDGHAYDGGGGSDCAGWCWDCVMRNYNCGSTWSNLCVTYYYNCRTRCERGQGTWC